MAARIRRNGGSKADFEDLIDEDPEAAAWKADHDQRQVDRAWERSDYGSDLSDFEGFGFNEDGVAMMFARRFGDRLRFDHTIGKWYQWNGSYWQRQDTQLAYDWVRGTCRALRIANAASAGVEKMATTRFATGVELFARRDNSAFAVTFEVWNRDPWLLGTPGGTVDLRTGELRPARQEDYISKVTAVAPNHPALAWPGRWLKFLREATGSDAALIRYLQQWCGYSLTGDTSEEQFLFIFGPGGNGKTVFLNLTTWTLNDYARTATMQTFMASQNDRHLTELARLEGARLVAAAETEQGRAWNETRIRQLTGSDTITANYMRQDHFEYRPQFKIIGIGNNKPRLTDIGLATRRRFNLVPFNFVPKVVNKNLEAELRDEAHDILAWMIEGCLDWRANGLCRPEVVVRATEEYFQEQDIIGRWLADRCEQDRRYKMLTTELHRDFVAYCEGVRERERSMTGFTDELLKRGFEKGRDTQGRSIFYGLRLSSDFDDEL